MSSRADSLEITVVRIGWTMKCVLATSALVLASLLSVGAFAQSASPPVMVSLPTGSRLATWSIEGDTAKPRQAPVVFLHGGPGLYTEQRRINEGAVFRRMGFDTVYFDQAGGGKSDRLPAADYSLDRAVADLEALRVHLGQDQMILWGNSFGANLATVYASRFPEHVLALVLTAPGMFPGLDAKRDYRVTNRDKVEYSEAITSAVDRIDRMGASAESELSQEESGRLFDEMVSNELIEGVICKGSTVKPEALPGGGNLYAQRALSRDVKKTKLPSRSAINIPTLIIRGSCDFIPMKSAERYRQYFDGQLVLVDNAGHGLLEQRSAVDAAISAFMETLRPGAQ
jgi:pimeloyl-ACP methyl ester carboxylesterase